MDLEYELIIPELALAGFAVLIGAGALMFRQVKQEVWGYLSALGLLASYRWDLPSGPAIVCVLGALLVLFALWRRLRRAVPPPAES